MGYGPDDTAPLAAFPELAELLATQHNLRTMLVTQRAARRDLAVPPHAEPRPSRSPSPWDPAPYAAPASTTLPNPPPPRLPPASATPRHQSSTTPFATTPTPKPGSPPCQLAANRSFKAAHGMQGTASPAARQLMRDPPDTP
ncbi:DUF6177 family protein [Streptomyces sp. NBC_00212]